MSWVRVTVTRIAGSAPRDAGTQMLVHPDRIEGTIGGGALEWQVMQTARRMLNLDAPDMTETVPLGPSLGQCCGGSVSLKFEAGLALEQSPKRAVWIWGAGHVGRVLADVIAQLPDTDVTLIDISDDKFPETLPSSITPVVARDPTRLVAHAPTNAEHLILTHSHELDLALCHAVLERGFAQAGLIGSATKWARFRKRLSDLGHLPAKIDQIACPIGDPALGKHPMQIAIGVAAAMTKTAQSNPREIAS